MKVPSKNLGRVQQSTPQRPLQSISETKMLSGESLSKRTKAPHSSTDLGSGEPHSKRSQERSEHYHAKVVGGKRDSGIKRLNPTRVVPAARTFPGL